jgi:transposase-like protein
MHKSKMTCPNCGAEMNHHAMKIDYRTGDPELQEVHTCTGCGRTELRQAE